MQQVMRGVRGRDGIPFLLTSSSNKNTFVRGISRTSCVKSAEKIEVSVANGVKKIVINRPEANNALSFGMMGKLGTTLYESNTDNATKIITITGVGNFFSSGNDLRNMTDGTVPEVKEKARQHVLNEFMYGFIDCQKPIIAMVNGGSVGAGVTLLPFCDLVLASDKATFHTPFPALGIVPEFCSSVTFPRIMGLPKANDMLLFGHKLTAKEALDVGLVTKLFPSESFAATCEKLVNMYKKLPLEPLLKSKELIRAYERDRLKQLAAYEMDYVIEASGSPLMKTLLQQFFSKKKK